MYFMVELMQFDVGFERRRVQDGSRDSCLSNCSQEAALRSDGADCIRCGGGRCS